MKILDYYIARTVVLTTLLVLFAFICLGFFVQLMGEFGTIGKGHYGMVQALKYAALTLPQMIYQIFPMIGLVGVMLGLGTLSHHHELMVMRAGGVSIRSITRAVLLGVLVMVGVMTLVGEWVAPSLFRTAELFKIVEKSGGQAITAKNSLWVRDKNSFIHIERVFGSKTLQNVTRYVFNDEQVLLEVSHAKTVHFKKGVWQAQEVSTSFLKPGGVVSSTSSFALWPVTLIPDVLQVAQIAPEEMSLPSLLSMVNYKKANHLNVAHYELSLWQRLLQPLATGVMMFLAIPFIFGPMRSVTAGLRLLAGILMGFGFYILNQFFGPFSLVYQLPPFVGAILPTLLFALMAYMMMLRVS